MLDKNGNMLIDNKWYVDETGFDGRLMQFIDGCFVPENSEETIFGERFTELAPFMVPVC